MKIKLYETDSYLNTNEMIHDYSFMYQIVNMIILLCTR